jgi:hypothetical protein
MPYHFELVCPRCNKQSETIADLLLPAPHVNCGDCLMNDVEIVEMKVVSIKRPANEIDNGTASHDR